MSRRKPTHTIIDTGARRRDNSRQRSKRGSSPILNPTVNSDQTGMEIMAWPQPISAPTRHATRGEESPAGRRRASSCNSTRLDRVDGFEAARDAPAGPQTVACVLRGGDPVHRCVRLILIGHDVPAFTLKAQLWSWLRFASERRHTLRACRCPGVQAHRRPLERQGKSRDRTTWVPTRINEC